MPFRLLNEIKQKKLSTSTKLLPLFTLLLGFVLTGFVSVRFQKNDKQIQINSLKNSAHEYFKNQNLLLNNSILKLQYFNELSSYMKMTREDRRLLIEQIVETTVFQRASLFRLVKQKKGEKPVFKLMTRYRSQSDTLPLSTDSTLTSPYQFNKINILMENSSNHALIVGEIQSQYYISLALRSHTNPSEFFIFTSSLKNFLKDWPKNNKLVGILKDLDNNITLYLTYDDKENTVKYSTDYFLKEKDKRIYFIEQNYLIDEIYNVSYQWLYLKSNKISTFVWTVFSFGIILSIMVSLLMRFILERNKQISLLVDSRTEQLEIAMHEAQEANKAKSLFLANMSHELRTPLNLILGMSDILKNRILDTKSSEYLKSIHSAGEHLLNLITDLISMSKEQSVDIEIKNSTFSVLQLIEEISFIFGSDCIKKNVDFKIHISHDLPAYLLGDPVKIRQIIINLLRNALKYTTKGSIILKLSLIKITNQPPPLAHIQIEVSDTGIGIPEDKMNIIFNRFFQIEESKTLAEGGVGLGLSIVKELVSKMNGHITVNSKEGVGSNFKVNLNLEVKADHTWLEPFSHSTQTILNIVLIEASDFQKKTIQEIIPKSMAKISGVSTEDLDKSNFPINSYTHFISFEKNINSKFVDRLSPQQKFIYIYSDKNKTLPSLKNEIITLGLHPILPSKLLKALGFINSQDTSPIETRMNNFLDSAVALDRIIKILVIDDDDGNRELLKAYFDSETYQVFEADNGQSGLKQYHQHQPDVVIADLRMPIMNGFQLTEEIKKLESLKATSQKTPIILLTADVLEETIHKASKYKVDLFLTKPVRKKLLIDSVHRLVRKMPNPP